jgi:hypothetical protein
MNLITPVIAHISEANPFPPRHFRRKKGEKYGTTHTRALLARLQAGHGHFKTVSPPGECTHAHSPAPFEFERSPSGEWS